MGKTPRDRGPFFSVDSCTNGCALFLSGRELSLFLNPGIILSDEVVYKVAYGR